MTPRQLVAVSVARGVLVGLLGASVALAVAIALSPLTPFGLARFVEPHPGLSVEGSVLGAGAAALALLTVLVSLPAAFRVARLRGDAPGSAEVRGHPSAIDRGLARTGLGPAGAVGVRFALEPGRGGTTTPVRSTVLGLTLALAGLTIAFGFGASLDHLLRTPRLYGVDWDLTLHSWSTHQNAAGIWTPALRQERRVSEFSTGTILLGQGRQIVVGTPGGHGVRTQVWGLDAVQGAVTPTVIDGRWPRSDDEIALGTKTLSAIDAGVGDSVRIAAGGGPVAMRVVGRAVFPEISPGPAGIGNGAGLTFRGLRRLIPGVRAQDVLIRLAPGTHPRDVARRFQGYQGVPSLAAGPDLFTGLEELHHAEAMPLVLGGVLALAALLTLGHMLISSIRRRRHDLAILKTLGFVRRQVSATLAWQATTLAVLALAIGLPLGLAGGRWGWSLFTGHIGVVPEVVIPLVAVSIAIPGTILVANLIAIVPGRMASRLRPAIVLRSE
jgi:hypothetical protein